MTQDHEAKSTKWSKEELECQIMSSSVTKNEREWWAQHEIESLRLALREADAIIHAVNCNNDVRKHWPVLWPDHLREAVMRSIKRSRKRKEDDALRLVPSKHETSPLSGSDNAPRGAYTTTLLEEQLRAARASGLEEAAKYHDEMVEYYSVLREGALTLGEMPYAGCLSNRINIHEASALAIRALNGQCTPKTPPPQPSKIEKTT